MTSSGTILLTGATGLLGRAVLTRLLAAGCRGQVVALVRDPRRASASFAAIPGSDRVSCVEGDLTRDGLGLSAAQRAMLRGSLRGVVHLAADTTFSRPLPAARAVNTDGTQRVLALAADCATPPRLAYVSTAFVAGRRTGEIAEAADPGGAGWVNHYEQSKWEAEQLVRQQAGAWTVLRCSTVVCDDASGGVTQFNAAHRALRLYRDGLAAMMPGVAGSTVDTVTTDYVASGVAALGLRDDTVGRTLQLCAGQRALPLEAMLDLCWDHWSRDTAWRRRSIPRPALADLTTYALFERTIEDTAEPSLKRVTRALSHFVPQLALPKQFATAMTDALLGAVAPDPLTYWPAMLDHLLRTLWGSVRRAA